MGTEQIRTKIHFRTTYPLYLNSSRSTREISVACSECKSGTPYITISFDVSKPILLLSLSKGGAMEFKLSIKYRFSSVYLHLLVINA